MSLKKKARDLFRLLDEVEELIDSSDTASLSEDTAKKLAARLHEVADLVEDKYKPATTQESTGEESSSQSESIEDTVEDTVYESDSESSAPAPPPSLPRSSSAPTVQPTPPSRSLYKTITHPKPEVIDEYSRKRRREAEEIVKKLKPRSFGCGVSYTGDANDKRHTDNVKDAIKRELPPLKTNKHIFHYMAWATIERLNCDYCRKCPNTYPED